MNIGSVRHCIEAIEYCLPRPGPGVEPPSDPYDETHVPVHDGHPFGVDSSKIAIFEQLDEKGFGRLLQGAQGGGLEPHVVTTHLWNKFS